MLCSLGRLYAFLLGNIFYSFALDTLTCAFLFPHPVDFKIKTAELQGKKIKLPIRARAGQAPSRTHVTAPTTGEGQVPGQHVTSPVGQVLKTPANGLETQMGVPGRVSRESRWETSVKQDQELHLEENRPQRSMEFDF